MYDNIGGKIKGLAKATFIVEAIAAVITGIALMAGGDMILEGFLVMILGPIVAWVSSWLLYAFGELVEKTCNNEANTRQILNALRRKSLEDVGVPSSETETSNKKETETKTVQGSSHKWLCDECKKMRTQTPCEHCGKE